MGKNNKAKLSKEDRKAKTRIEQIKEEMANEKAPVKHVFEDNDGDMPKALAFFKDEVDAIKSAELNCFFNNVLIAAPASFQNDEALLKKVKKAYDILNHLLTANDVQDIAKEALLGTVLISKILENEFKDAKYPNLYPVATRLYIEEIGEDKVLPRNLFENIVRAIESHLGNKTVSMMLKPKAGTAEAEIANAFTLAEMDNFL